jgi:AmiR/NasT family two-component response regulator
MDESRSQQAMSVVESGTADEARVALARLLSVTGASLERTAQLERALTSRIVIEQAKGVLSERLHLGPDDAFEVLRRAARTSQRKLHDLAREVVASRETPAAILAAQTRARR